MHPTPSATFTVIPITKAFILSPIRTQLHEVRLDRIRPSFSKMYDIYGLVVVLLELGLRNTIEKEYNRFLKQSNFKTLSASDIRAWMIKELVPRLGEKTGLLYRDVTLYVYGMTSMWTVRQRWN
jgi:hypothetical protein